MLYDLRAYIFTIVAVFLALGLGLLLGSAMPGNNVLVNEQVQLIGQLEADFQKMRQENQRYQAELASLQASLKTYREFGEAILPQLVKGRLGGKRVLVLESGASRDSEGVEEVLRMAGARVQRLPGSASPVPRSPAARRFLEEYINEMALDAMVIVNGPVAADNLLPQTLQNLRHRGITLVAVENSGLEPSLVPLYRRYGVSSVDNIEGVPGKVALVWLLQGAKGHFGIKATSQGLLPPQGD